MRRFVRAAMEWKTAAALSYTATMVIYMVIAALTGDTVMTLGTGFGLLALCLLGSAIQYVCFTEAVIRRMRYSRRLLLFAAMFFPVLTVLAVVMRWFPSESAGSWALFCILALVIFAIITVGFELYFWIAGQKYDGLLGQYRRQREKES